MLLMPPSLEEWLGQDHLARFLHEAVQAMDLKGLYAQYREGSETRRMTPG